MRVSKQVVTLRINSGAQESQSLSLRGRYVVGINFPALTSCTLTFQTSTDGSNWVSIADVLDGAFTAPTTLQLTTFTGNIFLSGNYVNRLNGAPELRFFSSVAQAADRDIAVVLSTAPSP